MKLFRTSHESPSAPAVGPHQIQTYADLRHQIHDDLRLQHPEWIRPDGTSPICDSYEARLMKLLGDSDEREVWLNDCGESGIKRGLNLTGVL